MAHIKAVVTLPYLSGLPEDVSVNTFHFSISGGTVTPTQRADLIAAVEGFYNVADGTTGESIAKWYSHVVNRSGDACGVDLYISASPGGPFGSPIESDTWTLGAVASGVTPYPGEVAIVASFAADVAGVAEVVPGGAPGPAGDTRPRARRRGRVYLGPLNTGCAIVASGTSRVTVHPAVQNTIVGKMQDLFLGAQSTGAEWCVYSPTDDLLRPITHGWVDDAFDTQRRRGEQPTARTVLTF